VTAASLQQWGALSVNFPSQFDSHSTMEVRLTRIFRVSTKQYEGALEAVVTEIGGFVINADFGYHSTAWTAVATFPAGTRPPAVARRLRAKLPGVAVTVETIR